MTVQDLIARYAPLPRPHKQRAVFANLFMVQNRLQTLFDKSDDTVTLKQFMLLILAKQAQQPLTFTQLGELLGCSRQNVKKLAVQLEQKGFVSIQESPADPRACCLVLTSAMGAHMSEMEARRTRLLDLLFQDHTDAELEAMFTGFAKLYGGMQRMEAALKEEKP